MCKVFVHSSWSVAIVVTRAISMLGILLNGNFSILKVFITVTYFLGN
jgi:hypothetical protein